MASDDHIVRELLAALDAGDIDTAMGFLTEDVTFRDYRIHMDVNPVFVMQTA
jgi:ketosteroid isomerase-like protein